MAGRMSLIILAGSAACLLAGCSGASEAVDNQVSTALTDRDQLLLASARIALPPAGFTVSDLPDADSSGARSLGNYCQSCHNLPTPSLHSRTDWPSVLRRMWLRMERLPENAAVPVPSSAERMVMLNYVLDHALQVAAVDLPMGAGRDLFVRTCEQCHELPDPHQHGSQDWVPVVLRMVDHMDETLNGSDLTMDERNRIIVYLQSVSET